MNLYLCNDKKTFNQKIYAKSHLDALNKFKKLHGVEIKMVLRIECANYREYFAPDHIYSISIFQQ